MELLAHYSYGAVDECMVVIMGRITCYDVQWLPEFDGNDAH